MPNKPPLGVSPHWFVYQQRMEELNDAIGRYLNHIKVNHSIENQFLHYGVIAKWAKEIETLALLEAELEKKGE